MYNSINEECGVFGIFDVKNASELTYFGLQALQHRGQEGCGIVSYDDKFYFHKGEGLVSKVFGNDEISKLTGNSAIGHVRYSTTGESQLQNVQPFIFNSHDENFGLCHNGNIVNADLLKQELEKEGSIFQTTSDSEIIAHLVKRQKGDFITRLKNALPKLVGAYAFLFIFDDAMYAITDPSGLRPLSIAKLSGGYVISSETCAFDLVEADFMFDLKPATILKIDSEGISEYTYMNNTQDKLCAMEYIYFSRPDSNLRGSSVYNIRYNTGIKLASQKDTDVDVVVGVPDSGLAAAMGYAYGSKTKYVQGLVKNKYSGRTFIQPTDELRKLGIKLKLSVVKDLVKDKRVVVVDDSIVRGNTMKKIVQLLKAAGASEVHVRIASPEIYNPCFYGVDFSTAEELISAKLNNEALTKFISADSVDFLTVDNLKQAVNKDLCMACFDGKYPTKLYKAIEQANKEIK